MKFEGEKKEQQIRSLRGIVIGRWFLIFGFGALGVIQVLANVVTVTVSANTIFLLILVPAIFNLGYTAYLSQEHDKMSDFGLRILSFLQVVADQVMFTLIVYFTGGIDSAAYIIYFFPILTATVLYSDIEIILLALLSVSWYSGLVALEYKEIIPHIERFAGEASIYGDVSATLANTVTINMLLVFIAMFAVFVNRTILDRERAVTTERDNVRSILNSLEDGIIMLDERHRILLMNPIARDLLRLYDDFSEDQLKVEYFPNSFMPLIKVLREHTNAKRLGQEVHIVDGQNQLFMQVDSIPIYTSDGTIFSWVKVLNDVTREKQIDEMKSDFISIAAHQLRTPLSGLKWFFKIMLEGDAGEINEKQEDLLEKAYARNNEVIEIVNNLLDVSEIEEGRVPYEFVESSLTKLIEDIVRTARIDAERKGITVAFQKPTEELPKVSLDKQKMRMALQNLIHNAVKYSPENTTVQLTATMKNNRYYLTVADQGIGIPQAVQAKIFSKFFRAKNAKEKETTGSGLGLYIVKNIIQKHRGQIWFNSVEDQGTTFFISLPVDKRTIKKKARYQELVEVFSKKDIE